MSSYHDGRRVEYKVIHELRKNGYHCTRAASSKGAADVIAIKEGQVLLISVKKTDPPGLAERRRLIEVAWCIPGFGVPLVALGPASKVTYRELTGVGPQQWQPWTPDEVGA